MKAYVLHQTGDLRRANVHRPVPDADSALIRVAACGVCSSDILRIYKAGMRRYPIIPGHEFSGTVEFVGARANKALVGARVAVFPLIPCRSCECCEIGAYAQCDNYDAIGSRCDGAFAEFVTAPASNLLPLPENVSFEEAALVEPAAAAAHAVRLGEVKGGDVVAVFGAGPVGLLAAQWARIHGAAHVLIADTNSDRLPFAEQLGFTQLYNPRETDISSRIYALNPCGADVVIEASGASEALEAGIRCARSFGRMALLGIPDEEMTISSSAYTMMLRKELRLQGAWNSVYSRLPGNEWALALAAMASGQLQTAPLISHRCAYDGFIKLLAEVRDGATPFMKVMLTW